MSFGMLPWEKLPPYISVPLFTLLGLFLLLKHHSTSELVAGILALAYSVFILYRWLAASKSKNPSTIKLKGFDQLGEPEIRVLESGEVEIIFEFMPPSDFENRELGQFEDFDKQLQNACGVEVIWEDREFFSITNPKNDTVKRLKKFIEDYRVNYMKQK